MNDNPRDESLKGLLGLLMIGVGYLGYRMTNSLSGFIIFLLVGGFFVLLTFILLAPRTAMHVLGVSKELIIINITGVYVLDVLYLGLTLIFNKVIEENASLDRALHVLAWVLGALTILAFARIAQWKSGRLL